MDGTETNWIFDRILSDWFGVETSLEIVWEEGTKQ